MTAQPPRGSISSLLFLLFALTWCGTDTRAATIFKADDTVVRGEIVGFEHDVLTVKASNPPDDAAPQTIPIGDVLSVRLANPPPAQPSRPLPPTPLPISLAAPNDPPTTLPPLWQLKLAGGDQVSGNLRAWSNERILLEVPQSKITLEIPTRFVTSLWRGPADMIRKAKDLKINTAAKDAAYVIKDDDVVAVTGVAMGIQDQSLAFRYEEQDRKISLSRLLGVELVPQQIAAQTGDNAARQIVRFIGGDILSGRWTAMHGAMLSITTVWGQQLEVSSSNVDSIDVRNTRVVYLSDLKPVKVEQTPFFDRIIPWRNDAGLDGGPLKLSDGEYARGISMHSRCLLEYELDGQFERFKAKMGFEQVPGAIGRAVVRVSLDGKPAYENPDASSDQKPVDLDVDLKGAKRLTLEVDFGRDQDVADRVIFANARLFRGSAVD